MKRTLHRSPPALATPAGAAALTALDAPSRLDAPSIDTTAAPEPVKERILEGFGTRLAELRQARGLTQGELGALVGVSYRVIAYYERDDAQPPGAMLVDLAHALRCTTDELLGVKPVSDKLPPKTARLLKRLRRIEELPAADQRAVLKLVDAMIDTRRRTAPPARAKQRR